MFICIYFPFLRGLAWTTTCMFFNETTYLCLVTFKAVADGKKCCFKEYINFTYYHLIRRTLITRIEKAV